VITRRRALRVRYRLLPWWGRVTLIYFAARVVSTALILVLASVQGRNPWTGAHPAYFDYASIWDGTWYKIVALSGYPSALPMTADGHVGENAWAFLPAYPFLVRGISAITQAPWEYVSVFVSLFAGLGAALLFFLLMRRALGDKSDAMFSVVLFCVAPVSVLFQLAYAEALYLLLLVAALYLVSLRKYWVLAPIVTLMAFTRPSGLAFALFLGLHVIHRFVVRARDPFPWSERIAASVLAVFSAVAGLAWPAIAGLVTGDPAAYTDTELAWRSSYIGYTELVPFSSWFQGGNWWIGAPAGAIVVCILIVAFAISLFLAPVRRIGVDLRLWVASYVVYLLAVFFPQSSTFRLLMPAFPLLGAVAVPRSRAYRITMVVLFIAAQWGWLLICWGVDGLDWTPP
jgi:hypothetical protein